MNDFPSFHTHTIEHKLMLTLYHHNSHAQILVKSHVQIRIIRTMYVHSTIQSTCTFHTQAQMYKLPLAIPMYSMRLHCSTVTPLASCDSLTGTLVICYGIIFNFR